MKKILLVSASGRMGGAERSLVELARTVDQARFELHAVVGEAGRLAEALGAAGVGVHVVEMERLRRTVNPVRLAGYVAAVAKASRRVAGIIGSCGIDLVHSNGVISHVYAGEAASRAGVRCVWHARDMVRLGPIAERMVRHADRVIAISDAVRVYVSRLGAPRERVRVVRNGLDLTPFLEEPQRPAPAGESQSLPAAAGTQTPDDSVPSVSSVARVAARRELGLDERAFVAGSAGVFVPWKRHEDFVRAFAGLCEKEIAGLAAESGEPIRIAGLVPARAVVFGDDLFGEHGRYVFDLKRRADELVGERLVFPGWREDLARLLPALDVFVSTSENEPFGRVIVEAMAAGLPVVATDSGGRREMVEHGVTGVLVRQGDAAAAADALDALRRDPARRASLGREGRRVAFERFTVDRAAREVEAVYDEILAEDA